MLISSGTHFNAYLIGNSIGVGGMGEVYRATDTKLKRDVAIKVLPESFATDAERLARFQREAELLASLNHPNIAQIFGLEKADGITALVMELIDGPTLAERIEQGPLPTDDALTIALQIADALEAAHERGIVHRDLKPANIKLKTDGRVKVLDFGIAKALDNQAGNSAPQSPMLTTPAMTQSGMILGTAAYMSPEQARGKTVDRRTDIWAFGCVLYEMLTGQPAFGGEDVQETLARVITNKLELKALPKNVPPAVKQALELCLVKDPKKRIADISDVRLALKGTFGGSDAEFSARPPQPFWRRVLPVASAMLITGIVVGVGVSLLNTPPAAVPQPVARFDYSFPEDVFIRNAGRNVFAVSPDGSSFVFNTTQGLYLRNIGELEAHVIPGTEASLANPFYAPDGRTVAYYSGGQLQRIAIIGGVPVTITAVPENLFGASWSKDNSIFYGQPEGIYRVSANGGPTELVMEIQPGEVLGNPELLPDGTTLLVSATTSGGEQAQVIAYSLATGTRTVLLSSGGDARYIATGHLVYAVGNSLYAVAFDPATLEVKGAAAALVPDVLRARLTTSANYGVTSTGTLMFLSGNVVDILNTLVWVTRDGIETAIPIAADRYAYPRLSPNGRRVAIPASTAEGSTSSLWIWDFAAETRSLVSTNAWYSVWTADGTRIIYGTTENTIDWMPANSTAQPVRLSEFSYTGLEVPNPYFLSPSGQELVFRVQANPDTNDDIALITVGGSTEAVMLLNSPATERNAALSPDGRWMAYQSDESGQAEIYVRPFPNVADDRVQVSNSTGGKPLWSPDGRELFYLQLDTNTQESTLISVAVDPSAATFTFGARTTVMAWPYGNLNEGRDYDIAPDGQRFLATKPLQASAQDEASAITIVQNWTEELKRLVPVE